MVSIESIENELNGKIPRNKMLEIKASYLNLKLYRPRWRTSP